MQSNVSDRGFIFRDGKYGIICYNDDQDPGTIRFALAHELGHYVLKHTEEEASRITDQEANCFARNFLSPVPVTEQFDLNSINDCCDIFDITPPAAEVVLDKRKLDPHEYGCRDLQKCVSIIRIEVTNKEFPVKISFCPNNASSFRFCYRLG